MSVVSQLDIQASRETPVCKSGSPPDYFAQAATFLRNAGAAKKQNDLAGAYLNLKKYFVLILERLPANPQITQFTEEYYFNKEKCTSLTPELNNLKAQLEQSKPLPAAPTTTGKPLPPPPSAVKKDLPPPPTAARKELPPPPSTAKQQQPEQAENTTAPAPTTTTNSNSSWFSGWFGSKKAELPPPPSTIASQVVDKQLEKYQVSDDKLTNEQKFAMKQAEKVVMNDKVQQKVGSAVAHLAANEKVQAKVADGVSNAAQNKDYQKKFGAMVAESTDNAFVQTLATNEKVQQAMGTAVAKTIGNKEMQKKVGDAIAHAAQDKETQQKVASGLLTLGKYGML